VRLLCTDTDDLENPLRGGQPVRTFAINSRLARRHDITVFTAVYPGCKREVERAGVHYRRLGVYVPPFGLSPHLTFLSCLGAQVARTPHDLVVEEFTAPIGFCLLPRWTRKPVISSVQWNYTEEWGAKYHLPFTRWKKWVARQGWYRHFIVQTEAMKREFVRLVPGATIRVIPPGVDESAFLPVTTKGGYALFLGRLDQVTKGIDLLVEAWQRLAARNPVPLVIAGEGLDRAALEEDIEKRGLGGLITLAGRVEGERKKELLQGCRFCVMPSRFETFGISAAEAMAAGKPVVIFDIKHLNEVVRPAWGALVAPFDTEAFSRSVEELWDHPERCVEMGARAVREARHYLWDMLALRQEEFYLEVLKDAHA
jgi:glycosyltransferase involved in cell wall biosynthesis